MSSDCRHFSLVQNGDRWSTRGYVADCFERKGHKFVELDLLVVANDERPVMAIRHTAIYEPARRGVAGHESPPRRARRMADCGGA